MAHQRQGKIRGRICGQDYGNGNVDVDEADKGRSKIYRKLSSRNDGKGFGICGLISSPAIKMQKNTDYFLK